MLKCKEKQTEPISNAHQDRHPCSHWKDSEPLILQNWKIKTKRDQEDPDNLKTNSKNTIFCEFGGTRMIWGVGLGVLQEQKHGGNHKPTSKFLPHNPLSHLQWPKPRIPAKIPFDPDLDEQENPETKREFSHSYYPRIAAFFSPVDQIHNTSSGVKRNPEIPIWRKSNKRISKLWVLDFGWCNGDWF